jgi:hypothetical protein
MQLSEPDAASRDAEARARATVVAAAALLGAAVVLPSIAQAQTPPERGQVAVKYLDYLDSQPGASRVRVQAAALSVLAPLGDSWAVSGSSTVDSISGASPFLRSRQLTPLTDFRRAAEAQVTHYPRWGSVTIGSNVSSERDYFSRGALAQAAYSTPSRNTTWTVGFARNDDVINSTNRVAVGEQKRVDNLLLGMTQVLTRNDLVQVNLSRIVNRGYLSDPYKFADNRPDARDAHILLLRWNHYEPGGGRTWRWSWRHFRDTWAVRSHTLGLELHQTLPGGWAVVPNVRLYSQTAAFFHVKEEDSSFPFAPMASGPYTEDQRLSAFGAGTLGFKVIHRMGDDWTVDVKVERYEQRSSWSFMGRGTPGIEPFRARSIQVGIARAF